MGEAKRTITREKGLGTMNRSQLLKTQHRWAEVITGTMGAPANWAMVSTPGLTTPKGPWGPSTMWPTRNPCLVSLRSVLRARTPPLDDDPRTGRHPSMSATRAIISPSRLWLIMMAMGFRVVNKVMPGEKPLVPGRIDHCSVRIDRFLFIFGVHQPVPVGLRNEFDQQQAAPRKHVTVNEILGGALEFHDTGNKVRDIENEMLIAWLAHRGSTALA